MAFTYDITTSRGRVRFLLQDTTNTTARPALLADDEIDWVLTTEANLYMAAALCADALASRFRGTSSKSVGSLSLTYSSQAWEGIAKQLRMRGSLHQVISAGGVTVEDRDALWADATLLRPSFYSELQQDPRERVPQRGVNDEELA